MITKERRRRIKENLDAIATVYASIILTKPKDYSSVLWLLVDSVLFVGIKALNCDGGCSEERMLDMQIFTKVYDHERKCFSKVGACGYYSRTVSTPLEACDILAEITTLKVEKVNRTKERGIFRDIYDYHLVLKESEELECQKTS